MPSISRIATNLIVIPRFNNVASLAVLVLLQLLVKLTCASSGSCAPAGFGNSSLAPLTVL